MPIFQRPEQNGGGAGASRRPPQPPPGGMAGLAQQNSANQATTLGYMISLARPMRGPTKRNGKRGGKVRAVPSSKSKRKPKPGTKAWMAYIRKKAVKARKHK